MIMIGWQEHNNVNQECSQDVTRREKVWGGGGSDATMIMNNSQKSSLYTFNYVCVAC